jgi:hypothetical protein
VALEYKKGSRTVTYNTTLREKLRDTFVRRASPNTTSQKDIVWNHNDEIRNLKNINYYDLMDTVAMALAGSYEQMLFPRKGSKFPYTLWNDITLNFSPIPTSFSYLSNIDYANTVPRLAVGGDNLDIRKLRSYESLFEHRSSRLTVPRTEQYMNQRHGI